MRYFEFLEFLGRIAFEYFNGSEEEGLLLNEKIVKVFG
jgi:hypothetical protein